MTVMSKAVTVIFPKSSITRYAEAVSLAKLAGDGYSESTEHGLVHTATFEITPKNHQTVIILLDALSRTKSAKVTDEKGKFFVSARDASSVLGCYFQKQCPATMEENCRALDGSLGCDGMGMDSWFSRGCYKGEPKFGELTWHFYKSAIARDLKEIMAPVALLCPAYNKDKIRELVDKIPAEFVITPEYGFPQLFREFGIENDNPEYATGIEQEYQAHGEDLVQISSHHPACPVCKPWNGQIFSISGQSEKFQPLKLAIQGGLFHPGCAHALSLHIPLVPNGRLSSGKQNTPVWVEKLPALIVLLVIAGVLLFYRDWVYAGLAAFFLLPFGKKRRR